MTDIVTPAIQRATGGDPHTTLAMEFGALIEGGSLSGPFGIGDNGHSFGPFQINLPFHPGVTSAQAVDPNFAASFMAEAYRNAVAKIPDALWKSNPEQAAEQAAFLAERPAQQYHIARGQAAVDSAYNRAVTALGGSTGGGGGGFSLPNPLDLPFVGDPYAVLNPLGQIPGIPNPLDALNPANWLEDAIKAFITNGFVLRGTLMVAGLIILFIGLSQVSKGNQTATQTAGSGVETVRVQVRQARSTGKASASKAAEGTEAA